MTEHLQPIDTLKLTALKHLAGGKSIDVVATITHLDRDAVHTIAKNHGYPDRDKLAWAVDVIAKNIAKAEQAAIPQRTAPDPVRLSAHVPPATARPRIDTAPNTPTAPTAAVLTKPDEIRVLINTAKTHPSKRIQQAGDRVLDHVAKLQQLLVEDAEKNSARRQAEAEKAQARAEIERLEAQLREAKARLRGTTKTSSKQAGGQTARSGQTNDARATAVAAAGAALLSNADLEPHGLTSKTLRAWALLRDDLDCPTAGRLPRRILDAWIAAHPQVAAS